MERQGPNLVVIGDIALSREISPWGDQTLVGGAAYHSSVGAQVFSSEVGIVGRVGYDFDWGLLEGLKVKRDGISVDETQKTCHFTVVEDAEFKRHFTAERGAASRTFVEGMPASFLAAHYFHLATCLPEHYLDWIDYLRSNGSSEACVSIDVFEPYIETHSDSMTEAIAKADLVFMNEREYDLLKAKAILDPSKRVVLKRGSKGAVCIENSVTAFHAPAPEVEARDTNGAGDVLAGAYLALLSMGVDQGHALRAAVRLASLSVAAFGVAHILNESGHSFLQLDSIAEVKH
jgi:ribokinase